MSSVTTVLACGLTHMELHRTAGYNQRNYWCSTALAALDPSDPRVPHCHHHAATNLYFGVRVNVRGHLECSSKDGAACHARALTFEGCMASLRTTSDAIHLCPLVCTQAQYSDSGHWCTLLEQLTTRPSTAYLRPLLRGGVFGDLHRRRHALAWPASCGGACAMEAAVNNYFAERKAKLGWCGGRPPSALLVPTEDATDTTGAVLRTFQIPHDSDVKHVHVQLGQSPTASVTLEKYKMQHLVAIKTLRSGVSAAARHAFVHELHVLASISSPVRAVGTLVATHRVSIRMVGTRWIGKSLLDLAEALVHLHAIDRVHGQLISRHVLLDSVNGTKVTGVGSQHALDRLAQHTAPTSASDMYSFGVLLSEFGTHRDA
ncbi:hypothetical protein H310_11434 [Aphanomyces invadans]|uniref:Protein kinase domain-containing protein n=1 Tax=Aphanomyces invadans TaxID=157072 RepID=A0A024TNF8_9STRA|nr:hypothetical protein H310_11434 [Aphanomyces invadans]ETV95171.1 hypothetical protein H310_11434 [Aphanomyces invadans]|eukprot:XP_008876344.1 hypothetical protein H310_11434 [Aphanomyces invadans]